MEENIVSELDYLMSEINRLQFERDEDPQHVIHTDAIRKLIIQFVELDYSTRAPKHGVVNV